MIRDLISTLFLEPAALPVMAANSGTAIYPIKGIKYFVKTPILWGNLLLMAVPQLVLTFVVFSLVYIFLYPPQAAIALLFNGPTGVIAAWIGMLQEAVAFTQIISSIFLMPTPLRLMFDTILTNEGHDELVTTRRAQEQREDSDHRKVMAFLKAAPRRLLLPKWVFKIMFRVGLNFIPVIGPAILVLVDAKGTAVRCQSRYFVLKGFDKNEVGQYVKARKGQFFAFGVVAAALEALPFVGILFMFTNTCGGAIWASQVEQMVGAKRQPKKTRLAYLFD